MISEMNSVLMSSTYFIVFLYVLHINQDFNEVALNFENILQL